MGGPIGRTHGLTMKAWGQAFEFRRRPGHSTARSASFHSEEVLGRFFYLMRDSSAISTLPRDPRPRYGTTVKN